MNRWQRLVGMLVAAWIGNALAGLAADLLGHLRLQPLWLQLLAVGGVGLFWLLGSALLLGGLLGSVWLLLPARWHRTS